MLSFLTQPANDGLGNPRWDRPPTQKVAEQPRLPHLHLLCCIAQPDVGRQESPGRASLRSWQDGPGPCSRMGLHNQIRNRSLARHSRRTASRSSTTVPMKSCQAQRGAVPFQRTSADLRADLRSELAFSLGMPLVAVGDKDVLLALEAGKTQVNLLHGRNRPCAGLEVLVVSSKGTTISARLVRHAGSRRSALRWPGRCRCRCSWVR